jgi:hypothetical protein
LRSCGVLNMYKHYCEAQLRETPLPEESSHASGVKLTRCRGPVPERARVMTNKAIFASLFGFFPNHTAHELSESLPRLRCRIAIPNSTVRVMRGHHVTLKCFLARELARLCRRSPRAFVSEEALPLVPKLTLFGISPAPPRNA